MASGKIGRNELCPCGSGKKYKRCCIDKPAAALPAPPARPAPPSDPRGRATASRLAALGARGIAAFTRLMQDYDETAATEAERRMHGLLAPGGALDHIRFADGAAFEAATRVVVEEGLRGSAGVLAPDEAEIPAWLRAFRRTAPSLAAAAELDRLLEDVLAALRGRTLADPRDWDAACMFAIAGLMALESEPFTPGEVPLLELTFRAQIEERIAATHDTFADLNRLARDMETQGVVLDVESALESPLLDQAAARIQRDPFAAAALAKSLSRDVEAALDTIRDGQGPAFVAVEEQVFVMMELARALRSSPQDGSEPAPNALDALVDAITPAVREHLQARWTSRLFSWANEAGCPRGRRALLGRLLGAVTLAPGTVASWVARHPAVWWRSEEERAALEQALREEEDLLLLAQATADWLRSQGLDDSIAGQAIQIAGKIPPPAEPTAP